MTAQYITVLYYRTYSFRPLLTRSRNDITDLPVFSASPIQLTSSSLYNIARVRLC